MEKTDRDRILSVNVLDKASELRKEGLIPEKRQRVVACGHVKVWMVRAGYSRAEVNLAFTSKNGQSDFDRWYKAALDSSPS